MPNEAYSTLNMDEQELTVLLREIESDRVERKASTSDRQDIRKVICAFANDLPNHNKPGILFVGVNDDGTCANLPITDKLLLELSNIRLLMLLCEYIGLTTELKF